MRCATDIPISQILFFLSRKGAPVKKFFLLVSVLFATMIASSIAFSGIALADTQPANISVQLSSGGISQQVTTSASAITVAISPVSTLQTISFDDQVDNLSGDGASWKLIIGGGPLAFEDKSLVTKVTGITADCFSVNSCVKPTSNVDYSNPIVLDGSTHTILNAAPGTGMGSMKVTPTIGVIVPAFAYVGTYSAPLTVMTASGL